MRLENFSDRNAAVPGITSPHTIAAVVLSVIAGFALGGWLLGNEPQIDDDVANVDSSAPIEERLLSLEQLIAEERQARLNLEEKLQAVIDHIERLDSVGSRVVADREARAEEGAAQGTERRGARDFATMMRNFQARRLNQLTEGGFSEEEARRIMRREQELQYEAMLATHDARRNGEAVDMLAAAIAPQARLRAEMGDSDYERYLQAQGQPTAVQISQVLAGSPGSQAGLQSGDKIVRYNGSRVFDVSELRALTLDGRKGEDVIIEIERDGVTMQLNVPRGPVGITGSGANIRNTNFWGGG